MQTARRLPAIITWRFRCRHPGWPTSLASSVQWNRTARRAVTLGDIRLGSVPRRAGRGGWTNPAIRNGSRPVGRLGRSSRRQSPSQSGRLYPRRYPFTGSGPLRQEFGGGWVEWKEGASATEAFRGVVRPTAASRLMLFSFRRSRGAPRAPHRGLPRPQSIIRRPPPSRLPLDLSTQGRRFFREAVCRAERATVAFFGSVMAVEAQALAAALGRIFCADDAKGARLQVLRLQTCRTGSVAFCVPAMSKSRAPYALASCALTVVGGTAPNVPRTCFRSASGMRPQPRRVRHRGHGTSRGPHAVRVLRRTRRSPPGVQASW